MLALILWFLAWVATGGVVGMVIGRGLRGL